MTTIQGGSDDASPEQPPAVFGEEESGGPYRQDDAPHGADPRSETSPPPERIAPLPARSVVEIVTALAATSREFRRIIEGKSGEALAQPASDGEWGVVEILPHLRDWEEVYLDWIQQILDRDTPELMVVDDSLWAIEHDYANENVPNVLERFAGLRGEVVSLLQSLDDAAWQREAIHPQLGRITLHQLADRMCDHDARHIEQARDAMA
jgi:hypothetical protein